MTANPGTGFDTVPISSSKELNFPELRSVIVTLLVQILLWSVFFLSHFMALHLIKVAFLGLLLDHGWSQSKVCTFDTSILKHAYKCLGIHEHITACMFAQLYTQSVNEAECLSPQAYRTFIKVKPSSLSSSQHDGCKYLACITNKWASGMFTSWMTAKIID